MHSSQKEVDTEVGYQYGEESHHHIDVEPLRTSSQG